MSTRSKKLRRGRPTDRTETVASGKFRMIVAANPGSDVTVSSELDLVKAALLYGEKVTLLSPVTTMLLRVESLERFSPLQQIELVRRLAPVLVPADDGVQMEQGLAKVDEFLRRNTRGRSLGDRLLRAGLLEQFRPIHRILADAVREIAEGAGIDHLARARAAGIVEIESADPGDALDLLVACVISAKLAETGQRPEERYTDQVVETFVDNLSRHFASGREYLIFDQPVADLTEAAIREGVFTPATGPAGRSAQAMTASALMGRLPTFPNATVDEVLDIRKELSPSLTQFRSAMVTIARSLTSQPWESDFEDQVHDAWVESVAPAIEHIDASVRDNNSLFALATGTAGAVNTSFPGLLIVAAGLAGHADAAAAFGGVASATAPLLQAIKGRWDTNASIRMQPFYFLYSVDRALS